MFKLGSSSLAQRRQEEVERREQLQAHHPVNSVFNHEVKPLYAQITSNSAQSFDASAQPSFGRPPQPSFGQFAQPSFGRSVQSFSSKVAQSNTNTNANFDTTSISAQSLPTSFNNSMLSTQSEMRKSDAVHAASHAFSSTQALTSQAAQYNFSQRSGFQSYSVTDPAKIGQTQDSSTTKPVLSTPASGFSQPPAQQYMATNALNGGAHYQQQFMQQPLSHMHSEQYSSQSNKYDQAPPQQVVSAPQSQFTNEKPSSGLNSQLTNGFESQQPHLQPSSSYSNQPLNAAPPANQNLQTRRKESNELLIPRPRLTPVGGDVVRYFTCSGQNPPPAASDFVVVDEGNCSPRFIRLTINCVPLEAELIHSTRLEIGAILQPLASLNSSEEPVPIVNYGSGPLRCSRCLAYVNPFFKFTDGGAKFICNICFVKNDVPDDYRSNLDANSIRRDKFDRPELCRGSVEFSAGKEFIRKAITDPCYLFVIDVSSNAIISGLVDVAVQTIRRIVEAKSNDLRARIGILTYDTSVHFYSMRPGASEHTLFVMCDIDDPFVPCPSEDLLVRVSDADSRRLLMSVVDMLPTLYNRSRMQESLPAVGAAASCAAETLSEFGGKALLMQSGLSVIGCGKLEARDDASVYSTGKEHSLQVPQSPFYDVLATKCAESAVTIDLFVCANSYVDLASMSSLCEKTGGQLFMYPGFHVKKDKLALSRDLYHDCMRNTGFDALMVVRCTTGLRVTDLYGNFHHRRSNEMELSTIDADKSFGVRIEHDGKLNKGRDACIQCALLYTTQEGERRIRVHTISLPVTDVLPQIYRSADHDTIMNLSLRQACRQLIDATSTTAVQDDLADACVDSLYCYRTDCTSLNVPGQLVLPETLQLLPLSTLALIKHPLLQDGMPADEKSFLLQCVNSMPSYISTAFICPRLFNLTDLQEGTLVPDQSGCVFMPQPMKLSSESIDPRGLYLLDDSRFLYIYAGTALSQVDIEEVFDLNTDARAQGLSYVLRESDDIYSKPARIHVLVEALRRSKPYFQNIQIIAKRPVSAGHPGTGASVESLDESLFFRRLIEDASTAPPRLRSPMRGLDGTKLPVSMSYSEFLCYIHKRILSKFHEKTNGLW